MINLKAAMALGFEEPTRCSPTPKILFAAVHETEIGTFRTRRSCCAMSDIGGSSENICWRRVFRILTHNRPRTWSSIWYRLWRAAHMLRMQRFSPQPTPSCNPSVMICSNPKPGG